MKVLFSWVGFKDLKHIEGSQDDKFRAELTRKIKEARSKGSIIGEKEESPIAQLIANAKKKGEPFERVVLFFDLDSTTLSSGIKDYWDKRGSTIDIEDVESQDSHRYKVIWKPAVDRWRQVREALGNEIEPYFNLSSGTTSMSALFIFLGSTDYPERARFLQVSPKGIDEFSIDFALGTYAVNEALRPFDLPEFNSIIGRSPQITRVKKMAQKAAKTDCNILIYGESGTGKELLANAIHQASTRKNKPFHKINCAAIPAPLLESLLFGHKKGTFTGAEKDSPGLFKECNGGTLFLDEAEACAPEMQVKLLRVLQPPSERALTCRKFTPIGGTQEEESDVRIIAATNERLDKKKEFRSDFLNRLSTLTISLPALRERPEDLRELAQKLFDAIKKQLGEAFKHKKLTDSAIKFIESRAWSGNVRELQNALTQAIVFGEGDKVTDADFDSDLPERPTVDPSAGAPQNSPTPSDVDLSEPIDLPKLLKEQEIQLKKRFIEPALKKTGGNKTAAARLLGIRHYQTLNDWITDCKAEMES